MAMPLWNRIQAYVLFPLGILLTSLWHALGHPVETLYVLISPFNMQHYYRHIEFRVDNYYARLTRESMQADLRAALVNTFRNNGDDIIAALEPAMSPWRRWTWQDRGPLYALFDEFAVTVVDAQSGRTSRVWTQGGFASFVAGRLGSDAGVAPLLFRMFCYSARYPFTQRYAPADEQQMGLYEWVQAVAMLATDAPDRVDYGRAVYAMTGPTIWFEFASMAVPCVKKDDDGGDDGDEKPPSVLEQVAFVASARLPLDYALRGPKLLEILPRVRKLVTDAECVRPVTADLCIPYHDLVCLLGALLQVRKPGPDAARLQQFVSKHHGLGMAKPSADMNRAMHIAVSRQILAIGGIHSESTISYTQYKALWHRLHLGPEDPWHASDTWSFHNEMRLVWRSLFTGNAPVPNEKVHHRNKSNSRVRKATQPPPPLVLQALDFLYPLPSYGCTRGDRRAFTLSDTREGRELSRDNFVHALTNRYRPVMVVVYGQTTGADTQPALFVVFLSSPLWFTASNGNTDDFYVDDKHLLMQLAPDARALHYQFPKDKTKKDLFRNLVTVGDDSIAFGSTSGLRLDFASCSATLSARGHAGHYVDVPVGVREYAPDPVRPPTAWTTTMHITRVEVYHGADGIPVDLVKEQREESLP